MGDVGEAEKAMIYLGVLLNGRMLDPFEPFVYFEYTEFAAPTPTHGQGDAKHQRHDRQGDAVCRLVEMLSAALREWFPDRLKYGKLS